MKCAVSLFLLAGFFFFVGCEDSREAESEVPTGMWEYVGALPDGKQAILRVSVQEGPFLKYLGFRNPEIELSPEQATELANQLEQRWMASPEMLVRFFSAEFRGHGGATDGVLFLRYNKEDGTLESFYTDSAGVIFRPVTEFQEFRF